MDDFVFQNPTMIYFGKSHETEVGRIASQYGRRVLLHFGGQSAERSGLLPLIRKELAGAGLTYFELGGVQPNPRLSLVYRGIELCRENKIDLILAVGGGSAIDSAKAIAAGVPYSGDVWDFYTGRAAPEKALPIGTVLTIPAAGSESSPGSVITKEEGLLKRAVNADCLFPRFSILNPERATTLPSAQVANGVTDIMCHLMERYFTNSRPVEFTDRLIEATLRTVIASAPRVLANPTSYDDWAELMWAGTIAHNNLLNTGREGDWASHDIEHELSALYDIAHGAGLAIVTPAWMKYALKHDVARFAQYAVRVWGAEDNYFDPERVAREGIARLEAFWRSVGQKVRLSEIGIDDSRFTEMARKCTDGDTHSVGHFVPLHSKDIEAIYRLAL
jgi:alcohol dehydrogenase YqhD (iron-dependent ADH family)